MESWDDMLAGGLTSSLFLNVQNLEKSTLASLTVGRTDPAVSLSYLIREGSLGPSLSASPDICPMQTAGHQALQVIREGG